MTAIQLTTGLAILFGFFALWFFLFEAPAASVTWLLGAGFAFLSTTGIIKVYYHA